MAKDKERSINPAQQQRKLDKAKALKKGKAEVQARRNEKLAHRNPDRLQRQVDDLKALETSGDIKPREKQILADLERDLRAICKAREALGDKAPQFGNRTGPQVKREGRPENYGPNNSSTLGKRHHDGERKSHHGHRRSNRQTSPSSGSETDESNLSAKTHTFYPVAPPPRPRFLFLLSNNPKTTYESAPQIRDLRKEAVSRFVPTVVRAKQAAVRGTGGKLVEPEEMDRLEASGYVVAAGGGGAASSTTAAGEPGVEEMQRQEEDEDEDEAKRLAEEEERFRRELDMVDYQEEAEAEERSTPLVDNKLSLGNQDGGEVAAAAGGGGGLVPHYSRQVEMEEVDDEDM